MYFSQLIFLIAIYLSSGNWQLLLSVLYILNNAIGSVYTSDLCAMYPVQSYPAVRAKWSLLFLSSLKVIVATKDCFKPTFYDNYNVYTYMYVHV